MKTRDLARTYLCTPLLRWTRPCFLSISSNVSCNRKYTTWKSYITTLKVYGLNKIHIKNPTSFKLAVRLFICFLRSSCWDSIHSSSSTSKTMSFMFSVSYGCSAELYCSVIHFFLSPVGAGPTSTTIYFMFFPPLVQDLPLQQCPLCYVSCGCRTYLYNNVLCALSPVGAGPTSTIYFLFSFLLWCSTYLYYNVLHTVRLLWVQEGPWTLLCWGHRPCFYLRVSSVSRPCLPSPCIAPHRHQCRLATRNMLYILIN